MPPFFLSSKEKGCSKILLGDLKIKFKTTWTSHVDSLAIWFPVPTCRSERKLWLIYIKLTCALNLLQSPQARQCFPSQWDAVCDGARETSGAAARFLLPRAECTNPGSPAGIYVVGARASAQGRTSWGDVASLVCLCGVRELPVKVSGKVPALYLQLRWSCGCFCHAGTDLPLGYQPELRFGCVPPLLED